LSDALKASDNYSRTIKYSKTIKIHIEAASPANGGSLSFYPLFKMKKKQQTLIWRLSTEGVAHPSFLLGTMHVGTSDALTFVDEMRDCIQQSTCFATEINLDEVDPATMQAALQLPDNQRIQDILGEKWTAKTDKILKKYFNIPLHYFTHLKPIALHNYITESILPDNNDTALDMQLWQYAKEMGLQLRGVETFDEQIATLYKIPIDHQIKALKNTVANMTTYRKQLLQLTQLYTKADIRQMYRHSQNSAGKLRQLMLYNRNRIMADRIAALVQAQKTCIAIGAGHLWGQKGVLRLLQLRGVSVKPI
jgi:uncharacterized protein